MEVGNVNAFTNGLRESFVRILDDHLLSLNKMLAPFRWESVKPIAESLRADHNIFLDIFEDSLNRLLDIPGETKLEFADAKFGALDAIDQLAEGTPAKQLSVVSQFLKKQRILNTVSPADLEEIKRASQETVDFNAVEAASDASDGQKVQFLRFVEEFQQFYAFTSDRKILTFDPIMTRLGSTGHSFGAVVALDQLDSVFAIANADGNVFFTSGPLLGIASTHHFSLLT
jgi:hypothetical protein